MFFKVIQVIGVICEICGLKKPTRTINLSENLGLTHTHRLPVLY